MTPTAKLGSRKERLAQYLPVAVFLLSALVSAAVTWYVTGTYLDSDSASELVLAKHLADTRQLLSQDWIYGTELRVFQMQWVFAPLMCFLNNWHLVRFLGTMILQTAYILSFAYMARQAGFRWQTIWYGAALLLLPVSVTYGRIVLYHTYYITYITMSLLIFGLVLNLNRTFRPRKLRSWLLVGVLMAVSFLSGTNSIRQMMITHAPMLFSIVLLSLRQDTPESRSAAILSRPALRLLAFALVAAACSFAAVKFNQAVLHKYFTDNPYYSEATNLMEAACLRNMVYGYLHQFGFRISVPLLSLFGILSVASLVAFGYGLYVSVVQIRDGLTPRGLVMLQLFSFSTVMAVVFLLTADIHTYFPLYLCLMWPWAVLPLVEGWGSNPKQYSPLHKNRIFAWIAALTVIFSGWLNVAWFFRAPGLSQAYEGLYYQERDTASRLSGASEFLLENGYQIGYAGYWNANVVTEMTNGAVRMIGLTASDDSEDGIQYYTFLTSLWLREAPNEKPFLLMDCGKQPPAEMAPYCVQVYADDCYCVYDITDLEAVRERLYS